MNRYLCKWGAGYVNEGETEEVGPDFFSWGRGYYDDDRAAIRTLEVGQTWTAPTPEVHTVTRIA